MVGRGLALRAALAGALLAAGATAATARGILVDTLSGIGSCSVGASWCEGVDIHGTGIFNTAYVYSQGLVTFDGLLAANAVIGDPSTYGGVKWFAAGASASSNYQVSLYTLQDFDTGIRAYAFNFYTQGQQVFDTFDNPDTEEVDETSFGEFPVMQVQLRPTYFEWDWNDGYPRYGETQLAAGYANGFVPAAGAVVGFGLDGLTQYEKNENGLQVGGIAGPSTDVATAFGAFVDGTSGLCQYDENSYDGCAYDEYGNMLWEQLPTDPYRTGPSGFHVERIQIPPSPAPEPATWATMLIGFGALGFGLRRRRAVSAVA